MSKRERIILILMIVVGMIGAYTYLFDSKKKDNTDLQQKAMEESNKFLTEMSKEITNDPYSILDDYIVTRSLEEWKGESFLSTNSLLKSEQEASINEEDVKEGSDNDFIYKYTGFLEMLDHKFAIINGVEYEEGDALEGDGLTIISISKGSVILRGDDGNDIVVNLEDTP